MDAGGLAQMTYPSFPNGGDLGLPGSGFASRGKGSHIKQLAVPPRNPPGLTSAGQAGENVPTPRTSRSHLLANLRTAPRSPAYPPSAPASQLQHQTGLGGSKYADQELPRSHMNVGPKTSIGASFPSQHVQGFSATPAGPEHQIYSLPEQVLAPPAIQIGDDQGEEQMDPNLYAELVATNLYLAQQQQRLQQQLINVTAAAQQFNGLSMNETMAYQQQQMLQQQLQQQLNAQSVAQNMGFYNQQQIHGMQPTVTSVAGAQPGLYSVYNPLTGQQAYFMDQNLQQQTQYASSPALSPETTSPPALDRPQFRSQMSGSPTASNVPALTRSTPSPPQTSTSPDQAVQALPPPSANAFRRGHKKTVSTAPGLASSASTDLKPGLKSAAFPVTPMTGTFGPGQARAGEHPIRQPRGPPPLEELIASPTTKHAGSKNFATRQRRRAVHSLVRAGIERRGAGTRGNSYDSYESMTPVSDAEITFSISSDNDTDSLGSGNLSGKPSLGSLRAAANGAIGSERKELKERSRERDSLGSQFTAASVSSDEGAVVGGKLVEVKPDAVGAVTGPTVVVRKTPMLVLSSAEKRKTTPVC